MEFLNPFFSECATFFSSYGCLFQLIFVSRVLWDFNKMYYLTVGNKSIQILDFHIWNKLHKTLRSKLSFQTYERSLNIGLDLGASAKLAVTWIVSIFLDLICLILVLYSKFCTFRIILLYNVYLIQTYINSKAHFYQNVHFWGCNIFFLLSTSPVNSILLLIVHICKIHVFGEAFFPPSNHCYDSWKECLFLV